MAARREIADDKERGRVCFCAAKVKFDRAEGEFKKCPLFRGDGISRVKCVIWRCCRSQLSKPSLRNRNAHEDEMIRGKLSGTKIDKPMGMPLVEFQVVYSVLYVSKRSLL